MMHGIAATAEDLDNYDHHHLAQVSKGKVIGFIVSTYGEGDPPDNAVALLEQLQLFSNSGKSLSRLRYFICGLGNSKYQYFNKFADVVDESLRLSGAERSSHVGKLDAAKDSYLDWNNRNGQLLVEPCNMNISRALTTAYPFTSPRSKWWTSNMSAPKLHPLSTSLSFMLPNHTAASRPASRQFLLQDAYQHRVHEAIYISNLT